MPMLHRNLTIALVLFSLALLSGCEGAEQNCERACDRWVNQCERWDQETCMSDCLADDGWGSYTDCIQEAPCFSLDELCDP